MGGNEKHTRWKIYLNNRFSLSPKRRQPPPPPEEFVCPLTGSLMFDPVVVPSGQTFERISVEACINLGFTPALPDGVVPDFSALIPNLAIKSAIASWCRKTGTDPTRPPDYDEVEKMIESKFQGQKAVKSGLGAEIGVSERELLKAVADVPVVLLSHAASELTPRINHSCSSSSSEESVIVASSPPTPLPLTTRPACYSSSFSSASSCEVSESESYLSARNASNPQFLSAEEQDLFRGLKSTDVYEQEQAVISLRRITRTKEEARVSFCNPQLLSTIKSLIESRYGVLQVNAIASLVNLSLEKLNKVVIVRAGLLPVLIDVLKSGSGEAQEHAAGALFSLALDDDSKMAIGVLGALQPLLHALRSDSDRTRRDSALALYHLSLVHSIRVKLVKLGAVSTLLSLAKSPESAGLVMLVLCNLAASAEGKSAMLDANAVTILVEKLREDQFDSEATLENCVAALLSLSHNSLRFRGLAKEARAAEVLRQVEESGSVRAKEKARKILQILKGRVADEEEEVDWEAALNSASLGGNQCRSGGDGGAPNSTNF